MDDRIARSQAQEHRIAKRTGGSRNSGSGNGWKRKADVRSSGLLWEMKRTDKRQLTLKADDLEAVHKAAWIEGVSPVMHLELGGRSYVLLEETDYFELQDRSCQTSPAVTPPARPVPSPYSGTKSIPNGCTSPLI